MITRFSFPKASFLLSATSLLLASVSLILGQQVNYLDYLSFFSAMALLMVASGIAALLMGVIGTWQTRGRSVPLWIANVVAILILSMYAFDS